MCNLIHLKVTGTPPELDDFSAVWIPGVFGNSLDLERAIAGIHFFWATLYMGPDEMVVGLFEAERPYVFLNSVSKHFPKLTFRIIEEDDSEGFRAEMVLQGGNVVELSAHDDPDMVSKAYEGWIGCRHVEVMPDGGDHLGRSSQPAEVLA
jgi:hypothetical protein